MTLSTGDRLGRYEIYIRVCRRPLVQCVSRRTAAVAEVRWRN
ncbi:hypothetical protein ACFLQM_00925 [Acidobacteriota bacterium]